MDGRAETSPHAVSLRRLFPDAQFVHTDDLTATDAFEDSRACRSGSVFAVIRGTRCDGREFIPDALARGAVGLLSDAEIPRAVPQCIVPNVRSAFARLCAELAGHPSGRLRVLGVTGTNGKTTVTWMLRSILKQAGCGCGVLGTVSYHDGRVSEPSTLTTPDSRTWNRWLTRMAAAGTTHAAVELSSHALHQDRAAGTLLAAAAVTNITHDHFDYHGNFDAYRQSKARIAELLSPSGVMALNADDAGSHSLRDLVSSPVVLFGTAGDCAVAGRVLEESRSHLRFRLTLDGHHHECRMSVIGRHNVSNALAAAAVTHHLGVRPEYIVAGLEQFRGAPGRLERIEVGQPFDVFVDYAHTDDALRRCLHTLRSVTAGRLICVFGAGGNRDRSKRPLLGRAAALADVPIVTSDNPRHEDPLKIIDDILEGLRGLDRQPIVEPDRGAAIEAAISFARPGDCILVAGKGHEREQIVGDDRLPFDDRVVTRTLLRNAKLAPHPRQAGN